MPHIVNNLIWHNGEKIGSIDGEHVRDHENNKIGYFENNHVYNEHGYKVAYIQDNKLHYEAGRDPSELEHINELIEGPNSMLAKCAVKVLFNL